MKENKHFPEPSPSAEVFDTVLKEFADKLTEITTTETTLGTLNADRVKLRDKMEFTLNSRQGHVETVAKENDAVILSAGFTLRSAPTATTSLAAPDQVTATMGDAPGEIDLSWHRVPKARTYVVEMRNHSDTAAPGPWSQAKLSTRSSTTITGLGSGQRYAFRIRAIGPHDLESPWSGEAGCMAP
ncbi:MAG: fibronectin type III domain-containing protein [Verrucomicrobiota bacterium]